MALYPKIQRRKNVILFSKKFGKQHIEFELNRNTAMCQQQAVMNSTAIDMNYLDLCILNQLTQINRMNETVHAIERLRFGTFCAVCDVG